MSDIKIKKEHIEKVNPNIDKLHGMALHMSVFMPISVDLICDYIELVYPQFSNSDVRKFNKFYNQAVKAGKSKNAKKLNIMTSKMLKRLGMKQEIFV